MDAEASIHIDAPPERVWRMVADVTRMGEWSPITYRCEWVEGDGPKEGARFKGYNSMPPAKWWTLCEVVEAEPGKSFAFRTIDGNFAVGMRGQEMTRWRYTFDPDGIGTKVTETYEIVRTPPLVKWPTAIGKLIPGVRGALAKRERGTKDAMQTTLERLKAAAEET